MIGISGANAVPRKVCEHFRFSVQIFLFDISNRWKGGCLRYQRHFLSSGRTFSFFGQKIFSSISQFVEVAHVKKCQRYPRSALNSIGVFLFFSPNIFSSISLTVEREISPIKNAVP